MIYSELCKSASLKEIREIITSAPSKYVEFMISLDVDYEKRDDACSNRMKNIEA